MKRAHPPLIIVSALAFGFVIGNLLAPGTLADEIVCLIGLLASGISMVIVLFSSVDTPDLSQHPPNMGEPGFAVEGTIVHARFEWNRPTWFYKLLHKLGRNQRKCGVHVIDEASITGISLMEYAPHGYVDWDYRK